MSAVARLLLAAALCAGPAVARPQTMLDQEERLIDIHSLLLDLPPLQAPAALPAGTVDAALEVVTIPEIDGTTGTKEQITASDRTAILRWPPGRERYCSAVARPYPRTSPRRRISGWKWNRR